MKHGTESDEECINHLMEESGVEGSDALQRALLDLRSESAGPVSAPSGELAQLMSPKVVALRGPHRAGKAASVGLVVAAAAGLSVSGVAAASPQFRTAADHTVQRIVQFFDPSSAVNPIEPPADTAPAPVPDVLPSTEPPGADPTSRDAASGKTGPGEAASEEDPPEKPKSHNERNPESPGQRIGNGIAPGLSPAADRLDLPGLADVAPGLGHAGNGERPDRGQGIDHGETKQQGHNKPGETKQQGPDKLGPGKQAHNERQGRAPGRMQPNGPRQTDRSETSDSTELPSHFSEFTRLGPLNPGGK